MSPSPSHDTTQPGDIIINPKIYEMGKMFRVNYALSWRNCRTKLFLVKNPLLGLFGVICHCRSYSSSAC